MALTGCARAAYAPELAAAVPRTRRGNIVNEHTERVSAGLSRARDRATTAWREYERPVNERRRKRQASGEDYTKPKLCYNLCIYI